MKKKIFAIVGFVVLCFGSIVFAGQNTNSGTMQNMNGNMSSGNMSGMGHRRHKHRMHRKHRKHRHMKMKMDNTNANQ